MNKKDSVSKRIKLNKDEKNFLWQLLSVFWENKDDMYYEIDTDPKMNKVFKDLSKLCGFSTEPQMNKKAVDKCLKVLGS